MPDYAQLSCVPCGFGTYAPTYGSILCQTCPPGTFNPVLGASNKSACLICPSGSYCPYIATQSPTTCPPGYFCLEGDVAPRNCKSLYTSDPGSSKCHLSSNFYIIIGVSIGTVLIVLLVGWLIARQQRLQKRRQAMSLGDYESRKQLIPEPLPGPVYGGY